MSELSETSTPQTPPENAATVNPGHLPEHVDVMVSDAVIEPELLAAATAQAAAEIPSESAESLEVAPPTLTLGQQLAQQREQLGYSLEFVANHLKLSPRKIQQLEAGDWSAFPNGPFLSGFIRNYARLLQLNGAAMAALLPASSNGQLTEPAEIFQGSTFRPAAGLMPQPYGQPFWRKSSFFAVLLLVVVVALSLLLPDDIGHRLREWSAELGQVESAAQQPVLTPVPLDPKPNSETTTGAVIVDNPAPTPPATPAASTAALEQAAQAAAKSNAVAESSSKIASSAPVPVISTPPAASAAASQLHIKFQGPSWVEVKQKDGSVVSSQLNPPNTEKVVSGIAPLVLTIGNASSVQLQYKGKMIDLKPYTRDDVAHVTLN